MEYPFVTVAGWSAHQMSSTRSSFGHNRSISSLVRSTTPRPVSTAVKSPSTTEIPVMTAADLAPATQPTTPRPKRLFSPRMDDDNDLSTLPDPRSRAMSPASGDGFSSPAHHPDLDDEVATLSNKLINAINHQTTLDDNLSATRLELEGSYEKIRELEKHIAEQSEMLAGDVWVRRKSVEMERTRLLNRVAEEKRARQEVEQQKKKIEQELENLTAALFEEANKMVISAKEDARIEQEALQRKNDLLKSQLADTEGLLRSQQEQLAELKQVMEHMSSERDDQTVATMPSSPGFSRFDARDDDRSDGALQPSPAEPLSPSYPTSFTHLVQPVLRTDLAAFHDFQDLIRTSKRVSGQRVSSAPTASSLMALGLGSAGSTNAPTNASTTSLSATPSPPNTSPQTPNTPASSASAGSATALVNLPHLKDTKFYKRALVEDIEPTLRLDTAPGLSWLARRTVLSAMTDGFLVVEPVPASAPTVRVKPEMYPCSLCGENRKEEEHFRTHRFRTSEAATAQRYPLCKYCLNRVRSTCDFLGFLRIVKDGHWRADDDDAEKAAWEESVRLREQMFWSRIGGGVLPAAHVSHPVGSAAPSIRGLKSPRVSQEEVRPTDKTADATAKEEKQLITKVVAVQAEVVASSEASSSTLEAEPPKSVSTATPMETPAPVPESAQMQTHPLDPTPEQELPKRLSLTIPASA